MLLHRVSNCSMNYVLIHSRVMYDDSGEIQLTYRRLHSPSSTPAATSQDYTLTNKIDHCPRGCRDVFVLRPLSVYNRERVSNRLRVSRVVVVNFIFLANEFV